MQQSHMPTAAELIVGAALGCNTAWVSMSFKSLGLYAGLAHSEAVLDTVYLTSIVSVVLTLIVAGTFAQATERLLLRKESMWLLPVIVAATTLAMPLCTGLPEGANIVGMVAVGVASGVSSGLFLIRFGIAFSLLSTGSCVVGAATGTVLASLLFALFLQFERFSACSFAAAMPLVAGLLLSYGMHLLVDQGKSESVEHAAAQSEKVRKQSAAGAAALSTPAKPSARKAQHDGTVDAACIAYASSPQSVNAAIGSKGGKTAGANAPAAPDAAADKALRRLTMQLALCSALIGFSVEAVRTLYVQMGVKDLGRAAYALVEGGGAFVATVIVVAIALALATMKTPRMARNIYHFLILLLTASVLMLLGPIVYGQEAALIAHALNSAAYACFGMFMWVILAGVCNRYPGQRVRTFAFVRAGWALGPLVGMIAGRFVLHHLGISVESAMPIMAAGVLAVLVASGFAFSETDLVRAMDLLPLQHKQRFREKCAKVAADYALSERESEVMVLLAKGRNLPFIQDELLLSKSTVSTHRQHIYAKLDIHSQQELINLVQNAEV